jgi:hypothetical protein
MKPIAIAPSIQAAAGPYHRECGASIDGETAEREPDD